MADEKKVDVLEDIKTAEKKIKRASFLKMIPRLKIMAKEVNTLKKKAEFLLDEVGISKEDSKRVIDFINSLPSVELSESDLKKLREDMKEDVQETKKQTERDFEKSLEKFANNSLVGGSTTDYIGYANMSSTGASWGNGALGGIGRMVLTSAGKDLKVGI